MSAVPNRDLAVLVEGESDRLAVVSLAVMAHRDLSRVEMVVLNGATNARAAASRLAMGGLLAMCDEAETSHFSSVVAVEDLFVCRPDLEAELIEAAGVEGVAAVIEEAGESGSLHRLRMQPQHRGRPLELVMRRFMGSQSGRKARYARALVESLGVQRAPDPLRDLVYRLPPQAE
jgi:hypothetical protein